MTQLIWLEFPFPKRASDYSRSPVWPIQLGSPSLRHSTLDLLRSPHMLCQAAIPQERVWPVWALLWPLWSVSPKVHFPKTQCISTSEFYPQAVPSSPSSRESLNCQSSPIWHVWPSQRPITLAYPSFPLEMDIILGKGKLAQSEDRALYCAVLAREGTDQLVDLTDWTGWTAGQGAQYHVYSCTSVCVSACPFVCVCMLATHLLDNC